MQHDGRWFFISNVIIIIIIIIIILILALYTDLPNKPPLQWGLEIFFIFSRAIEAFTFYEFPGLSMF
jgi:hypothetical protein